MSLVSLEGSAYGIGLGNFIVSEGAIVPPGFVGMFAGPETSIPSGWLKCDGAQVSRTEYEDLFTAIGTTWGVGDESTTFHLPDCRGMFPRGVDEGQGNDPDTNLRFNNQGGNTGDQVGSYQLDELGTHAHTMEGAGGHNHSYDKGKVNDQDEQDVVNFNNDNQEGYVGSVEGDHEHTINEKGGNETRPINFGIYFIIKT